MNQLEAMAVFLAVARGGSFSAAARLRGMSATAVSRHVAELEAFLGVALLRRTTRKLSLTDAGTRYLPRAAAILEEISALDDETRTVDTTPRGRLRITAPPGIGHDWIAMTAVDFVEANPQISLELDLTERVVDLVAEGFDAAIRSGRLHSSSLIAHKIVDVEYILCGNREHLTDTGWPAHPDDLARFRFIQWCGGSGQENWWMERDGKRHQVPVNHLLKINDIRAHREAAMRGLGLAMLPALSVRGDLAAGRLVRVLPDYESEPARLHLVRPPSPFEPPRLRVFIDFITAALRAFSTRGDAA